MQPIPDDFKILNLKALQSRYKDEAMKKSIALMVRVFMSILDEHQLTTRTVLDPRDPLPEDFVLRRRDLTDEGLDFYRAAEQKWLSAFDRGTPATDTAILIKVLRKLRKG